MRTQLDQSQPPSKTSWRNFVNFSRMKGSFGIPNSLWYATILLRWRRMLFALVLPSRPLSTSKVSTSPSLKLSGSTPADCSALMCRNISGPPESSLMKPKPRSAFHIFKIPVAIALFPLRLHSRAGLKAISSLRARWRIAETLRLSRSAIAVTVSSGASARSCSSS
jgi:hypothetical protein